MTNTAHENVDDSQHGRNPLVAKISGWPVEPRPLYVLNASCFFSIIADAAMLLLSVAFISTHSREPKFVQHFAV